MKIFIHIFYTESVFFFSFKNYEYSLCIFTKQFRCITITTVLQYPKIIKEENIFFKIPFYTFDEHFLPYSINNGVIRDTNILFIDLLIGCFTFNYSCYNCLGII